MNKFRLSAVAIALAALFGSASPSSAAFLMRVSVDNGAFFQVASGSDFQTIQFQGYVSATGITGTNPNNPPPAGSIFQIKTLSTSSDNGGFFGDLSDLMSSTNSVLNISTTTAHTIRIQVTQTDYTLPNGNTLHVESSMGGSGAGNLTTLMGVFRAYADDGNSPYGTGGFANPIQNASANGSSYDTGSANGTFIRSGTYSLTSDVFLSVNAKGAVNYSNHVNVTAVPGPAGLVSLASGAPFLLALAWLRRRLAKPQQA